MACNVAAAGSIARAVDNVECVPNAVRLRPHALRNRVRGTHVRGSSLVFPCVVFARTGTRVCPVCYPEIPRGSFPTSPNEVLVAINAERPTVSGVQSCHDSTRPLREICYPQTHGRMELIRLRETHACARPQTDQERCAGRIIERSNTGTLLQSALDTRRCNVSTVRSRRHFFPMFGQTCAGKHRTASASRARHQLRR